MSRSLFLLKMLKILIASFFLHQVALSAEEALAVDPEKNESLLGFISRLFNADFMPHGHCFFWRSDILWLHVISDALIAIAYFSIPLMLLHFKKRRTDLPYPWVLALFAGFIFWCGTTHIMNIVTLWNPIYRVEGVIKFITASISVLTAILLFPLIPQALSLRSAKELEEEKAKRRDLEKFAHIASHDLREPLRTISLFSDLLKTKIQSDADKEVAEYLSHIARNAKRMNSLIEDLVSYSRIDTGESQYENTQIGECLSKAIENLAVSIHDSKAQISKKLPSPIEANVIPIQIIQLFQNLIANAIKFHKPGTKPIIEISASFKEGQWLIAVRDEGIGFEEQFRENIFLVFKRLHSNEDTYPGTGMGLAICKKIVEQHQGHIWAESHPDQGATFYFTLPARKV